MPLDNFFVIRKWFQSWINELFIIILAFGLINLFITLIGFENFGSILICQILNFTSSLLFLIYTKYKIEKAKIENQQSLKSFLKKRFLFIDGLLVIWLLFFGLVSIYLMKKIKSVDFFNFYFSPHNNFHLQFSYPQIWIMVSMTVVILILIVFAEELYFRGYLFNIQHVRFGQYTWIINGFSWCIYHIFSPQNILVLLPQCLMYSYVYQKRRNIWITIMAHLISNLLAIYPILKTYY